MLINNDWDESSIFENLLFHNYGWIATLNGLNEIRWRGDQDIYMEIVSWRSGHLSINSAEPYLSFYKGRLAALRAFEKNRNVEKS